MKDEMFVDEGVWAKKGEWEESPTKRERRRAICWNWRSVGLLGSGVLSAKGSATKFGGICDRLILLVVTAVLSSFRSFDNVEI